MPLCSSSRNLFSPPPGGFLFEGLSDDEDDFHPVSGLAACQLEEMVPGMPLSLGLGTPKLGGGLNPSGGQSMSYYSFLGLAAWRGSFCSCRRGGVRLGMSQCHFPDPGYLSSPDLQVHAL